jgi:cytochrome b
VDDESKTFKLHMLLGGVMAFMVVLRVIWGFVGSRWARFRSFAFGPGEVIEYFRGLVTGTDRRYPGHNPAASWAIYVMLALSLGLAITGANLGAGSEVAEELHEVMAFALAAVVAAHVLGALLHSARHRDNILASMVHGYKEGEPEYAIRRAHPLVGLLFVGLTAAWTFRVVMSHDAATNLVTLPVLGTTITLGDAAERESESEDHDED